VLSLIYLNTRSYNYSGDGTEVLWCLRDWLDGVPAPIYDAFNYHYILYCLITASLMRMVYSLGLRPDIAAVALTMQGIAGAATISCFFLLLRSLALPALRALIFSFLLAFSFAFWNYSVELEHHVIAWLFMVLAFLAVRIMCESKRSPYAVLFGVFYGLAISAHILFVLASPLTLIFFRGTRREKPDRRLLALYLCSLAGTLLLCFVVLTSFIKGSSFTSLFHEKHGSYFIISPRTNLYCLARGAAGVFLWPLASSPGIREKLVSGRCDLKVSIFLIAAALLIVVGITALWGLARGWRSYERPVERLVIFLVAWILFYSLFCSSYYPFEVRKFWGVILPPAWLLAAIAYRTAPRSCALFPLVFLVFLFFTNLCSAMLPQHDPRGVAAWMRLQTLREMIPRNEKVFVIPVMEYEAHGIRLFMGLEAAPALDVVSLDLLPGLLAQKKVYIELEAFEGTSAPYFRSRGGSIDTVQAYFLGKSRLEQVTTHGQWRLGLLAPALDMHPRQGEVRAQDAQGATSSLHLIDVGYIQ
jgi:hypothetical protein